MLENEYSHNHALGPAVAKSLDNYVVLLRKTNRKEEAAKVEAQAKVILAQK